MAVPAVVQAHKAPLLERHLLGHSQSISSTCLLIEKAGHSDAPVLLLGETGTGKEIACRMIHDVSGRTPLVTIDCSALHGALLESELFGHEKGAFTGAYSARKGLVEAADGGTAFFDEVGELPLDQQAKLLRLLQEKEFRRVGGTVAIRSDFRVIAATNRDLFEDVKRGRFREDLYYRLKVITLLLAPLRARVEDIPVVVRHFLDLYGCGQTVSAEVMQVLMSYAWPGNIRELGNCIHAMVALNSNATLSLEQIPEDFLGYGRHNPMTRQGPLAPSSGPTVENAVSVPILPLAEVERTAITQALLSLHGNCGEAARLLGIGRTTLYRKLKEYDIGFDESTGSREMVTRAHPPVDRPPGVPVLCGPSHVTSSPKLAPFARLALPPKGSAVKLNRPQERMGGGPERRRHPRGSAVDLIRLQEVEYRAPSLLIFPASATVKVTATEAWSSELAERALRGLERR
jgi:DNA-binding NtrC family response regulator